MSVEQRIDDLIKAGWGVVDSGFDLIVLHHWRRSAFASLTAGGGMPPGGMDQRERKNWTATRVLLSQTQSELHTEGVVDESQGIRYGAAGRKCGCIFGPRVRRGL